MLFTETVGSRTFSLLKELLKVPDLQEFYLVGGTALSLLYGHRISIDLDLFCPEKFNNQYIVNRLSAHFKERLEIRSSFGFGVFCYIDNLKVDLVRHSHPMVRLPCVWDGIRMFSTEDIIAMKVQAVLGRARKKYFWDIAELLNHFEVKDFIELHKEKFSTQNLLIAVPQAITYFVDAADDEDPVSLKGQTWTSVQRQIQRKVAEYLA